MQNIQDTTLKLNLVMENIQVTTLKLNLVMAHLQPLTKGPEMHDWNILNKL